MTRIGADRFRIGALFGLTATLAAVPAMADGIVTDIVTDIYRPARLLIGACCYVAGLCLVAAASFRFLRRAHDRFGPSLMGSTLMVLAGAALVNLPAWLEALAETLFGPDRASRLVLSTTTPATADSAALLDALVVLLFLIGLIASARGIALLPAAADGRATPIQALCHLFGGLALCNFPALAGALDTALGLDLILP